MNHTNKEHYNKPFSKKELSRAIQATKNSAPGREKIQNEMLKLLPPEGLDSLLVLYNKLWQQGYFPENWLEFTRIPISKPGKDPTNPSNYRPIALTSVLCTVMERMVHVRLFDFFDQKGTLSTVQCGGRTKPTTIDHLLSLDAIVRKAQANNEQVESIFFDMEKIIRFNMKTRHPDRETRSRNRRKDVQIHSKLSQTQML